MVPAAAPLEGSRRPVRRALLVSLLNPKAILFYLSVFIQFLDPTYPRPAVSSRAPNCFPGT